MKSKKFVQVLAMSVAFALGSLAAVPATAGGEHHQKHYQQEYKHDRRAEQNHRWVKKQHRSSKSDRHGHHRHHAGRYKYQGWKRYDKGYERGYEDARDRYDDNDDLGLALVTGILLSNVIFY